MTIAVNVYSAEISRHSFYLRLPFVGSVFCNWSGLIAELEGCGTMKPRFGKEKNDKGERSFWAGRLFLSHSPASVVY